MRRPRALHLLLAWLAGFAVAAGAAERAEELDTPYVTTPANVVQAMLDLAAVHAGDRVIDLGSGDGRIVIAAAARGAVATGVEIDPALVAKSRVAARAAGLADRATFVEQDLFATDFSAADVVTLYLLPDVNARLRPKFFAELRPGARIVSHDYDLGREWPPDRTLVVAAPTKNIDNRKSSRLLLWVVPAHVEGRWHGGSGVPVALDLVQHYARVRGTLAWRGMRYRVDEQPITGRRVELQAYGPAGRSVRLILVATGDALVGQVRGDGDAAVRLVR